MVVRLHRAYCRPCELFSTESPPFRVVSKYKIERCQMSQVQTAHAQLKTPWPLTGHTQSQGLMRPAPRRQSQTGLGHPARTPTDCDTCGFGEGVVAATGTLEVSHYARRAPPQHLGDPPPLVSRGRGLRSTRIYREARTGLSERRERTPRARSPISGACTVLGLTGVLGGILVRGLG